MVNFFVFISLGLLNKKQLVLFLSFSLYFHMCVKVHLCECTWKAELDLGCQTSGTILLGLTLHILAQRSLIMVGYLTRKFQDTGCLHLPRAESTSV